MSGSVLSFPDGIPVLPQDAVELEEIDVELQGEGDAISSQHRAAMLDRIDRLRRLVEMNRCEGLILIGQDPVTGYFMHEICMEPEINRNELFGYMGVLEGLKLELSEEAAMSPTLTLSGRVVDPYEEYYE